MGTRDNAKADNNIQLQNGERMNGSKLTEGQIDYICRYALTPILQKAQEIKSRGSRYADGDLKNISEIFMAVGYWTDETLMRNDEFRAERINAEREDRGN
jgi:hypothetical protein